MKAMNMADYEDDNYQEDWGVYLSYIDKEQVGSFRVDLGMAKIAPIERLDHVVWVSLPLKQPNNDGLVVREEYETLIEIEDALVTMFASKYDAAYVGCLTVAGHRDFYFYAKGANHYDANLAKVIASFPEYQCRVSMKEDPEWECYFQFLYPAPQQFQSIQNARVVHMLEEHGDNLTTPRPVEHWVYFNAETDRDAFAQKTKEQGFEVKSLESSDDFEDEENDDNDDEDTERMPFRVCVKRVDPVDYASIDKCVLALWEIANECNGAYDGWETELVTNDDDFDDEDDHHHRCGCDHCEH